MYIVINSQCIGYGQKEGICFLNSFVLSQFFYKLIWFCSIASSKNGAFALLDHSDLIDPVGFLPKEIVVFFGYQGENRPAHRHPRFTLVSRLFPRFFIQPDLLCLLYMERFIAFVILQGRTLKMHSVFGGPNGRSV